MHPNPSFRKAAEAQNLAFAREQGFGMLTLAGPDGPLASHVPFVITPDGAEAQAHLARSNPILKALEAGPAPALIAVVGPYGYLSPDWYDLEEQVPTWNYVAVHLRGTLELAPLEGFRAHLDALSAQFEERVPDKTPWTAAKMDQDGLARMMRMILPVRMRIEKIDGTWKLAQNKPDAARLNAAEAMAGSALGSETAALAALMRTPPA